MPIIQQHSCGILLAKHQVTIVTIDDNGKIQTSWQQHSATPLFSPRCDVLQKLVSDIAKQQLRVNIGLCHDLMTHASLNITGVLKKREINYYINQTIKSTEYYYRYQVNKQHISVIAIKKKLLAHIIKIFKQSRLSIQGIEPGINKLAQLLPSNDQPQALLQQEQQDVVLYHIKNQALLDRTVINESNTHYYLTPHLTVWVDQKATNVPAELTGYTINYLSSLANDLETPEIINAYALALRNQR